MKKILLLSLVSVAMFSCKTGWSVEDQEQYLSDCMSMANNIGNAEEICDCGLQKAMESYGSKEEAEIAVKKMSEDEVFQLFAECM